MLVTAEVVLSHSSNVGLGVGAPSSHAMGVGLGEFFNGLWRAAVGVAFAENRVNGGSFHAVVASFEIFLFVVSGFSRVVREVIALFLELLNAGLELRDGGGDIRKLDDIGFRGFCEVTETGEFVRDLLLGGEAIGELGKNSASEGDVGEFDFDAGRLDEALDDGEEGVSGEGWGFVGLGVDDLGHDL